MGLNQGVGRSRRCFKEPEAGDGVAVSGDGDLAAVAAVSKSLRRPTWLKVYITMSPAAVAAVSKSLRRDSFRLPRLTRLCRSRRCFKEPEAARSRSAQEAGCRAAVAAVSKSLRRFSRIHLVLIPAAAAVAAVSKSLRRILSHSSCRNIPCAAVAAVSKSLRRDYLTKKALQGLKPQSPLFQRA